MTPTITATYAAIIAILYIAMSAYVIYRTTQRASVYAEEEDYDAVPYAPVMPTATPVAVEAAQEFYAENVDTDEEMTGNGTD